MRTARAYPTLNRSPVHYMAYTPVTLALKGKSSRSTSSGRGRKSWERYSIHSVEWTTKDQAGKAKSKKLHQQQWKALAGWCTSCSNISTQDVVFLGSNINICKATATKSRHKILKNHFWYYIKRTFFYIKRSRWTRYSICLHVPYLTGLLSLLHLGFALVKLKLAPAQMVARCVHTGQCRCC